MKTRLALTIILTLFPLYGILTSIAFQIHSEYVYESVLYIFNPIIELAIAPPVLIYLANERGIFLNFEEFIVLRILLNFGFWIPIGIVAFGFYRLACIIKSDNLQK